MDEIKQFILSLTIQLNMIFNFGLLVLVNILLAEGAEIFSYHEQKCAGDLSGNIQLDENTCYGMTGGNQQSFSVSNESDDYTVYVWYGNMQCNDAWSESFNHNDCRDLDKFSVLVSRGDVKSSIVKPQKHVKIDNFF